MRSENLIKVNESVSKLEKMLSQRVGLEYEVRKEIRDTVTGLKSIVCDEFPNVKSEADNFNDLYEDVLSTFLNHHSEEKAAKERLESSKTLVKTLMNKFGLKVLEKDGKRITFTEGTWVDKLDYDKFKKENPVLFKKYSESHYREGSLIVKEIKK